MMNTSPLYTQRHARLAEIMAAAGLRALALNPSPSLVYLTGLKFHLMERPVVALFQPERPVTLIMPELETAKAEGLPFAARVVAYGEDPASWVEVFRQGCQAAELEGQVGVEPTRLRVLELRLLEAAASKAIYVSGEEAVAQLRMCKDEGEIAAMRRAVDIAQRALQATLPSIKEGITESQIASELTLQLLRAGSEPESPFTPIVSGGPNSANPHASPSERPLQKGDLLVIDWGAVYHGYVSDLTRTFAIGPVEGEYIHIAHLVCEANAAGRAAARPSTTASEVDQAARKVIEQAGYGASFFHRLGHGLGLEGHEPPYIRTGNNLRLEPGMTFTIEPGIYLTGRGGVRIEDNVVITADGSETLSSLPRELITLD